MTVLSFRNGGTCLVVLLLLLISVGQADACGPDTDCVIGERHYRIRMPAGHDGKMLVGAIVHAHGYTGNARAAMRSAGFTALARRLGVALISTKSAGLGWSLPGSPSKGRLDVDELVYYDRVIADAARRFPIDVNRLVATGFSAGGMMVWNLACHRSEKFIGFVPIAGTFWQPMPKTCTSPPANVIHVHGDNDPVVPLKGRPIADTHQGEVAKVLSMYARYGGFGSATTSRNSGLTCRNRTNPSDQILSFCLYRGGHNFYISHIGLAWRMLVKADRL